jgi:hypothetical protein
MRLRLRIRRRFRFLLLDRGLGPLERVLERMLAQRQHLQLEPDLFQLREQRVGLVARQELADRSPSARAARPSHPRPRSPSTCRICRARRSRGSCRGRSSSSRARSIELRHRAFELLARDRTHGRRRLPVAAAVRAAVAQRAAVLPWDRQRSDRRRRCASPSRSLMLEDIPGATRATQTLPAHASLHRAGFRAERPTKR